MYDVRQSHSITSLPIGSMNTGPQKNTGDNLQNASRSQSDRKECPEKNQKPAGTPTTGRPRHVDMVRHHDGNEVMTPVLPVYRIEPTKPKDDLNPTPSVVHVVSRCWELGQHLCRITSNKNRVARLSPSLTSMGNDLNVEQTGCIIISVPSHMPTATADLAAVKHIAGDIPVIALAGANTHPSNLLKLASLASAVFLRPCDREDLLSAIETALLLKSSPIPAYKSRTWQRAPQTSSTAGIRI